MACNRADRADDPATPTINWQEIGDGRFDVAALVPDEVTQFVVKGRDGTSVVFEPADNLAAGTVSAPARFRWETADGRRFSSSVGRDPVTGR